MQHTNFIPEPRFVRTRTRGRLIHWVVDEAIYFITFGLRDAMPEHVLDEFFREREQLMRGTQNVTERARLDRVFGLRLDRDLDESRGASILRQHAEVVASALRFFDRDRYELQSWCVMPNHVHALLYIERGDDVPKIVHSWKSWTAHQIGRGVIWQREYFDRVIRSPQELSNTRQYIRDNPAKAGLRDWPWVG